MKWEEFWLYTKMWDMLSCHDGLLKNILEGWMKGKTTRHRKRLHTVNDGMVKKVNHQLFETVIYQPECLSYPLLPPINPVKYRLLNKPNSRQISQRVSRLTDCNFATRMIHCDMYWFFMFYACPPHIVYSVSWSAFWHFLLKNRLIDWLIDPKRGRK